MVINYFVKELGGDQLESPSSTYIFSGYPPSKILAQGSRKLRMLVCAKVQAHNTQIFAVQTRCKALY